MIKRTTAWEMSVPPDRNTKVWRYMDMGKFISMLEDSCLWFSSASNLEDSFEGSHSRQYVEMMESLPLTGKERNENIKFAQLLPHFTFINCWHMRESESYSMWKIYGRDNQSIAIQTTYDKLYNSLKNNPEIVLGIVDYRCYETENLNPTGTTELVPYFNKTKFYEEEQELRLVIQHDDELNSKLPSAASDIIKAQPKGLNIYVNLGRMIDRVYLSPVTPSSFINSVSSLLEKYELHELSRNVYQSALNGIPTYGPAI